MEITRLTLIYNVASSFNFNYNEPGPGVLWLCIVHIDIADRWSFEDTHHAFACANYVDHALVYKMIIIQLLASSTALLQ